MEPTPFSFSWEVPNLVTTFPSDRMHFELTTTSGAILDSHGPLYVVLPGSIGIVLSLILLSFSHGVFLI